MYFFAYAVGAVLLLIALILLARPIKWALKLMVNSALGCIGLIAFNLIGGLTGLYIGVNIATAVTVGILGLPGVAMILLLQLILTTN